MIGRRLNSCLALASACFAASASAAGAAPATRTLRVGAATLTVPAAWRLAAPRDATFVPDSPSRTIVTLGPPADRSLVPLALRPLAGQAPARAARLAGYRAWRYAGPAVDVTVLPTSAGVLGIACRGGCAAGVTRVSLRRAAVLAPSPDLAFRLRLPGILDRLNRARRDGRLALRRAPDAAAQARSAQALAAAHRDAARALRPLAGAPERPLVAALTDAADAYEALAQAGGSRARYLSGRRSVTSADAGLATAVDRAVRDDRLRAAPAPASATGSDGPRPLLLALAIATLLGGAAWLLRRRPAPAPPAKSGAPMPGTPPVGSGAPVPGSAPARSGAPIPALTRSPARLRAPARSGRPPRPAPTRSRVPPPPAPAPPRRTNPSGAAATRWDD